MLYIIVDMVFKPFCVWPDYLHAVYATAACTTEII